MVMMEGIEVGMDHEFIQAAKQDFFRILSKIEFDNDIDERLLGELFEANFADLELRTKSKDKLEIIEKARKQLDTSRHINEKASKDDYNELYALMNDLKPDEEK